MLYDRGELEARGERYAQQNACGVVDVLGYGLHGIVFSTTRKSAIKVHAGQAAYLRERNCYLRLQEHSVVQIRSLTVPELVQYDDTLWTVEMGIVAPPFVLDFAAAYLDVEPEFSAETLTDWEEEKREQFEDRWPQVLAVLAELRRYGIHQTDVSPGNLRFRD